MRWSFAMALALTMVGACGAQDGKDAKDGLTGPAPEIRFVIPLQGSAFDPLERVPFCIDVVVGELTGADVSLSSDVDGVLATGGLTPCDGGDLGGFAELSDAAHTLEFAFTDQASRVALASTTLVPTPNPVPTCTIAQPAADVLSSGADVPLRATAEDDGVPSSLIASLSSDLDGVVWTGSPNRDGLIGASLALSDGAHTLTLVVEDSRGARGTCSARVTLGACPDADGDGVDSCSGDCDDTVAGIFPEQVESANGLDDNCNGLVDEGTALYDDDGDGVTEVDGDCDDTDAGRAAGLPEIPDDGIDQDCSGTDTVTCYDDGDRDGFGGLPVLAIDGDCTDPGEASVDGDCDEMDGTVFPGAPEAPGDGIDQDCDGSDLFGCFADDDGDGVGGPGLTPSADADCDDPGESSVGNDCDDADPGVYPGALDRPDDGFDQDCNGVDSTRCYADDDGDGHGSSVVVVAPDGDCTDAGEAILADDCDDTDGAISPSAVEIGGDGIDQDCDGNDGVACHLDADGDGVGAAATVQSNDGDCNDPGESDLDDDCDDTDRSVYPGAPETPDDGVDQDCSGTDAVTCTPDDDGDGVGGSGTMVVPGGMCPPGGTTSGDCDDGDPAVYPGAPELRDGADNNCDGRCDEGLIGDGDLFVTELMINPGAVDDGQGEWIELHNPTSSPIRTCAGWTLDDQGSDSAEMPDILVEPMGFAVLCAEPDPALNGGVVCDGSYTYGGSGGFQLSNSGDEVELWFDGVAIDVFLYSSSFDSDGSAQALAGPFSALGNDNPVNWCDASTPMTGGDNGTPGAPNDCP